MTTVNFEVPPAVVLRRKAEEQREALKRNRSFRAGKANCPAGEFVGQSPGGAGCRCGVEQGVLSERDDPSSLAAFCFGDYVACPTWRAEKQRIEDGQRTPLAEQSLARPNRRQLRQVVSDDNIFAIDGNRDGRDT